MLAILFMNVHLRQVFKTVYRVLGPLSKVSIWIASTSELGAEKGNSRFGHEYLILA